MIDCTSHNPDCKYFELIIQYKELWLPICLFVLLFILLFIELHNIKSIYSWISRIIRRYNQIYNLDFFHSEMNVKQTYIENIDYFRTVWCKYSYDTKGVKMHTKFIAKFLRELGSPFGCQVGDNIWDCAKSASSFKLKAYFIHV